MMKYNIRQRRPDTQYEIGVLFMLDNVLLPHGGADPGVL